LPSIRNISRRESTVTWWYPASSGVKNVAVNAWSCQRRSIITPYSALGHT